MDKNINTFGEERKAGERLRSNPIYKKNNLKI